MKKENELDELKDRQIASNYSNHFARINPGGFNESSYQSSTQYFDEEIAAILPQSKAAKILEIGTGHGYLLKYLVEKGYSRLTGIDCCCDLMEIVKKNLGLSAERLEVADAREFLLGKDSQYDCIVMFDMIEHVEINEAKEIFNLCKKALSPKGTIILRTPNMANILGLYSLYMDITHVHCYTQWTLFHLLEESGFYDVRLFVPQRFSSKKRKLKVWINEKIHQFLFKIQDRTPVEWYGKNLVIYASVGQKIEK